MGWLGGGLSSVRGRRGPREPAGWLERGDLLELLTVHGAASSASKPTGVLMAHSQWWAVWGVAGVLVLT